VRQDFARERQMKQIVTSGFILDPNDTLIDTHKEIDHVLEEKGTEFEQREGEKVVYVDDFDYKFL
jgi:hypothetical protein